MRILIGLTYYLPYTSGLTLYAVRQARALAELGHEVTILTAQFDPSLPEEEQENGVKIVRVPVALRISKGVVMPQLLLKAWHLIKHADIVNLHVPQIDAAMLALIAKIMHKAVIVTYHCDLTMPRSMVNKIAGWVTGLAHHIAASMADTIVHNTQDFAQSSAFLKRYLDKLRVIQPPILVEKVTDDDLETFQRKYDIQKDEKIVGMVSRLAAEKGVEVLVEALPMIANQIPGARVVFAGEFLNVVGEEAYRDWLLPLIRELGSQWTFLGVLSEKEKTAFFKSCDVLVLPSINRTESFGMVQVEAMICGTTVVATDLPGVRQPVMQSGLGKIVPPKDSAALADAIIDLLQDYPDIDLNIVRELEQHYLPATVASAYEGIFREIVEKNG